MEPILDLPQSKLKRRGVQSDKISQVVRNRIGMEGMQDDPSIALQTSLERAGENQKRQFHFPVEATCDVDSTGRTGLFGHLTSLCTVKVGCLCELSVLDHCYPQSASERRLFN